MGKNRKDGKLVIEKEPLHAIMPFIFDKRTESEVYIKEVLDITELKRWVDKQNKKLDYKMTYFHALTAVFAKTVYNRPLLNRFIQGHRIYDRNVVSFSFVAKNKMVDDAKDMMVIINVDKEENALELSKRMAIDIFKANRYFVTFFTETFGNFIKHMSCSKVSDHRTFPTFVFNKVIIQKAKCFVGVNVSAV